MSPTEDPSEHVVVVIPKLYISQSHPDQSIRYVLFNESGTNAVLYCPGAGMVSTYMTLFQPLATQNPNLAILWVDRWTVGGSRGSGLLEELSDITVELMNKLEIEKVNPVCHSAGAYQALDLAKRHPESVDKLFCVCTHIPGSLSGSIAQTVLTKMPDFLFDSVTKLDQIPGLEKVWMQINRKKVEDKRDYTQFIETKELRDVLEAYKPDAAEVKRQAETMHVDYRMACQRITEIPRSYYEELYVGCPFDITWFTTEGDVLFGPANVKKVAEKMRTSNADMIVVENASHADIFMRKSVWAEIISRIQR